MTLLAALDDHASSGGTPRADEVDDPDPARSSPASRERHRTTAQSAGSTRSTRSAGSAGSVAATPDAGSPAPVDLDLTDATRQVAAADLDWLCAKLSEALASMSVGGEVRIRIINDAEMSDAHERFSGVPGTTDVLTFDLADGASAPAERGGRSEPLDVDLMICLDEAARRTAEVPEHARHDGPRHELLLYALHGVLHCLGEDDHTAAGFKEMHAREDRVLTDIGVGPVFHRPTDQLRTNPSGDGADR